ncbi:MAG: serine/threonine-protein phosphatase [Streptosporangiaceae bacterium]|nr:serine/threonine-protein phosphatase [Streptosporangiaceae bacterium]
MTLALRYAVRSDVGLLREGNEDSAYAGPRLLAVADGMGGHAAGEVASAVTIASIAELDAEQPPEDLLKALSEAVAAANTRLQEMILANPAVEGMGTTLTALLWRDGQAALCHIGDSRGYLLRDGELYQITHDHTLVQSLVDEGRISADDVSTHPQRSLLLRALDGRTVAEPDLSAHDGHAGDRYLLCSDGLSGVVSDETLRQTLAATEDPETVARQLVELALHGGGPDNITCIVADVVDTSATLLPLTTTPVLAGAAAHADDLKLGADGTDPLSPFSGSDVVHNHHDDHGQAPRPAAPDDDLASMPLTAAGGNGTGPGTGRAGRGHRGKPRRRRRWPIVTTALAVLLAVVIGGGYIAWRWSQDQYYVAADAKGQVVIYRGINQRIAGISLSSPYQATAIELSQVPSNYQQTVQTAYASGSLAQVQQIVGNVRAAVNQCRQQYASVRNWVTAENGYSAAVAQAQRQRTKVTSIPKPGQRPSVDGMCPPSQAFGIPASSLVPAAAGQS